MAAPVLRLAINTPGQQVGTIIRSILRSIPGLRPSEIEARVRSGVRAFDAVWFRELVTHLAPAVRERLPVRTGQLKGGFRVYRAGTARSGDLLIFQFVWYGRYPIVRGIRGRGRASIIGLVNYEFARRIQGIFGRALQAALDAA